jgi:hypothetical protein
MKRCPKCQQIYHDNMLEFCLEDGTRLVLTSDSSTIDIKTHLKTEVFQQNTTPIDNAVKTDPNQITFKEKAFEKGYKTLETSTIVFALLHNYWQWLYLDKPNLYNLADFFLSTNFIVWFFVLVIGIILSLAALKLCKQKSFPIVSLVVIAINLLLFIVPRR